MIIKQITTKILDKITFNDHRIINTLNPHSYLTNQSSISSSFEIDVKGKTGITFKGTYPTEVSFASGGNVIVNSNSSSGKFKLEDVLEVCESMQLDSN